MSVHVCERERGIERERESNDIKRENIRVQTSQTYASAAQGARSRK
jgi:hypothetical protein